MRKLVLLTALLVITLPGAAAGAPTLIWSTYSNSTVSAADTTGGNGRDLFTGATFPSAVSVVSGSTADSSSGKVFWSNTYSGGIYSGNLDNPSQAPCLIVNGSDSGAVFPLGLTYNPANETLYWLNENDGFYSVRVPTGCSGAASSRLYSLSAFPAQSNGVSGLAIDPSNNRIYWPNLNSGTVGYAKLDGSTPTGGAGLITLSGCGLTRASSVNVDLPADRLYVGGAVGTQTVVASSGLNGEAPCSVITVGTYADGGAWGVARDTETLFAGNYGSSQINTWALNAFPGGMTLFGPGGTATLTNAEFPTVIDLPAGTVAVAPSTAEVGTELTCSASWETDSPGMQWYRAPRSRSISWSKDGAPIFGATGTTLKPDSAGEYSCNATGTNYAGSKTLTASATVTGAPAPTPPSPAPTPGPSPGPSPAPTPSNSFGVRTPLFAGNKIRTLVRVPGPGRVSQSGTFSIARSGRSAGTKMACVSATQAVTEAGAVRMQCLLTTAARSARRMGAIKVRLVTTFAPTGGTGRTRTQTVVLRSLKPRFTG